MFACFVGLGDNSRTKPVFLESIVQGVTEHLVPGPGPRHLEAPSSASSGAERLKEPSDKKGLIYS